MVLPRSAHLVRYPWHGNVANPKMGINTYGRQSVNGILCHKVGDSQADRVEALGYRIIKRGTGYVYVV